MNNKSAAARLRVEKGLTPTLKVRGGADARIDVYGFEQAPTGPRDHLVPSNANPPPTNVTWGGHADVVWRVVPRVEIVPGARVDVYQSWRDKPEGGEARTMVPAVDPRLAARVTLAEDVAWLSAFGLSHQYPALRVGDIPAPVVSVPSFPIGRARLQRVAQTSQGLELALPEDFVLTATGFLSGWTGLTDLTASCIEPEPGVVGPNPNPGEPRPPAPFQCPNNGPVHGRAFGLELLVRRLLSKRLAGWLSYTLSRSIREARFITPSGGVAVATVPSEFDRTHVLNAALAYDLGRRWRVGGRFVFYTGAPYSALDGNIPVPPYHDRRDPPFFRLDLRVEKRWPLGKDGSITFVVEGQNVTLSKEYTGFLAAALTSSS